MTTWHVLVKTSCHTCDHLSCACEDIIHVTTWHMPVKTSYMWPLDMSLWRCHKSKKPIKVERCINSSESTMQSLVQMIACSEPRHCPSQCWIIINLIHGKNLQGNFNVNSNIFIQENEFENMVCKLWAIGSGLNNVNSLFPGKCSCNYKLVILKCISRMVILSISCEIAHN